ncbi:MAG: PaaI family thioesterase [Minwuia sp.]|nr:PaaI family thioesterase [Minwuia sp.]
MDIDPNSLTWADKLGLMLANGHGQSKALGLSMESCTRDRSVLRLPWQEKLVGDPATRVLHGGVITTLIDSACGFALMGHLEQLGDIATLDLRIDYLQPAAPDLDVFAGAEVYKLTSSIAFLRASAYQTDGDPIATAVATFMLGANAPKYQAKRG